MQGNSPRSSEILTEILHDDTSTTIKSLLEAGQFSDSEFKTNYKLILNDDDFQNYLLTTLSDSPKDEISLEIRLQSVLAYFKETRLSISDFEGQKLLALKKAIINSIKNLYLDFESAITVIIQSNSKTSTPPSPLSLGQGDDDNQLPKDKVSVQLKSKKKIFVRQLIAILSEILSRSEDVNFTKKISKIFEKDFYKNSNEGNALLVIELKNLCVKKNHQQIMAMINSARTEPQELGLQDQSWHLKTQQVSRKIIDYFKYEFIFNCIFDQAKERVDELKISDPKFNGDAKVYLNFYRSFNLIIRTYAKDLSLNFPNINFRSYDCSQDSFKPNEKQIEEFYKIITAIADNDKLLKLVSKDIIKEIYDEKKSYVSEIFNLQNFKRLKGLIEEIAMDKIGHLMNLGIGSEDIDKIIDKSIYKCQVKIFKDEISNLLQDKNSLEIFSFKKITEIFDSVHKKTLIDLKFTHESKISTSPMPLNSPQGALSRKSSSEKEIS
jgi:hypothetical protein